MEREFKITDFVVRKNLLCIITRVIELRHLELMIVASKEDGTDRFGHYFGTLEDADDVQIVKMYKLDNDRDVRAGDIAKIGKYLYFIETTYEDSDEIRVRAILTAVQPIKNNDPNNGVSFNVRRDLGRATRSEVYEAYRLSYFMTDEEIAACEKMDAPVPTNIVMHMGTTQEIADKWNKPLRHEPKTEPHRIAKGDIVSVKDSSVEVTIYGTIINVNYDKDGYVHLNMNVFAAIDKYACSPRGYVVNKAYNVDDVTVIASLPYFMDKLMQHTPEVVSDTPSDKLVVLPYPIGHKVYYKSDDGTIHPGVIHQYTIAEKEFNIVVEKHGVRPSYFNLTKEVLDKRDRLSDNIADLA